MMKGRTIRDGIVVGLIGYAAVALFYSAFDQLAARGPLYTVDLLGKAMFRGLRDPAVLSFPIDRDAAAMFWYNALHLGAALVIGLIVMGLVGFAEEHPSSRSQVRFVIVAGFVATVVAVALLTAPISALIPWWSIIVANALSTVLAGAYLVKRRPGLWHRLALAH